MYSKSRISLTHSVSFERAEIRVMGWKCLKRTLESGIGTITFAGKKDECRKQLVGTMLNGTDE